MWGSRIEGDTCTSVRYVFICICMSIIYMYSAHFLQVIHDTYVQLIKVLDTAVEIVCSPERRPHEERTRLPTLATVLLSQRHDTADCK